MSGSNERKFGLYEVIGDAISEALSNLHTTAIAKVTKVDSTTINVRPLISREVDGKKINLPEFIEVPLVTLQGGSSYIHMPVAVGDEVLLAFSERCFDAWYAGNDYQKPLEYRMHDYSDAFAIVGINNQAKAITIPTVTTMIGDTYQEGNYEHIGNRDQTGDYTQLGNCTIEGNVDITGAVTITGTLSINGIDFSSHSHPQANDSAGNSQADVGAPK